MADEDERIRRCVREELELNLVSRTRNLIRSVASSSVNDLNNAFAGQTARRSSNLGPSSRLAIKRQNIPGHWNRPKKTKQEKTKHVQSIPKTVWLLERPDDDVQITDDGCYDPTLDIQEFLAIQNSGVQEKLKWESGFVGLIVDPLVQFSR